MSSKFKTTRICAGEYEVSDGTRKVRVTQVQYHDGKWWIAAADWNSERYTDPLETKRYAVEIAHDMLNDPFYEKYYAEQAAKGAC